MKISINEVADLVTELKTLIKETVFFECKIMAFNTKHKTTTVYAITIVNPTIVTYTKDNMTLKVALATLKALIKKRK